MESDKVDFSLLTPRAAALMERMIRAETELRMCLEVFRHLGVKDYVRLVAWGFVCPSCSRDDSSLLREVKSKVMTMAAALLHQYYGRVDSQREVEDQE